MLGASALHAQATTPAAAPWYRRARALDLTGANPQDSIVLMATGKRADSLAISMTFYVAGVVVHRQRWTSEDELADKDSLRKAPAKLTAFMRTRLDQVVSAVKREPINREQVSHIGDEAVLRKSFDNCWPKPASMMPCRSKALITECPAMLSSSLLITSAASRWRR